MCVCVGGVQVATAICTSGNLLRSESGSKKFFFQLKRITLAVKILGFLCYLFFKNRFAKLKPDSQIENRFAEKPDLSPTAS